MKRVRRFVVNGDDSERIKITLEYSKKASGWRSSEKIKDQFEFLADGVFQLLQKDWHTFAIKILK